MRLAFVLGTAVHSRIWFNNSLRPIIFSPIAGEVRPIKTANQAAVKYWYYCRLYKKAQIRHACVSVS